MSFQILIQVKGVHMCSIAKFLKTTKEVFFSFPSLLTGSEVSGGRLGI